MILFIMKNKGGNVSEMGNDDIVKYFWEQNSAYALKDFVKGGYYYDKKPLEAVVIRTVVKCSKQKMGDIK